MKPTIKFVSRFLIAFLLLSILLITGVSTTQSGLAWVYQITRNYLPPELTIEKLEGRLIGPIYIKGLAYRFENGSVKADQITLDWSPGALLSTHVDIHRVQVSSLEIQLPPSGTDGDEAKKAISLPDIHLPWQLTLEELLVKGIILNQGDEQLNFRQAKLRASTLLGKVKIEELSVENDNFNIAISGSLRPTRQYRHDLDIKWHARLPSKAMIQGHGQLIGSLKNTQITQDLNGALTLSLEARLHDILDNLSWQASANISNFDLRKGSTEWPALQGSLKLDSKGDLETATLSGTLEGDYPDSGPFDADFGLQRLSDNRIKIDHLNLRVSHSQTQLNSHGHWLPGADGGELRLVMSWKNLRWPMQESAWFDSANGKGSIEGNLDRYNIELTTDRPWPQAPPSTWSAQAEGDRNGLRIQSLYVSALGGETTAIGQLNWAPSLSWEAQINTAHLNPATLWPQWPGQINGTVTSSGRTEKGHLIADIDIKNLSGRLRDYPVALNSRFTWRGTSTENSAPKNPWLKNSGLEITQLNFSSGNARISAQEKIGESSTLKWHISATDIGALYPQAKGQLEAQGSLTGSREKPLIKAAIKGNHLSIPDYQIGTIEGRLAVDLFHWQDTEIELASQALLLNGQALQTLTINGGAQRLRIEAVADPASVQLELEGQPTSKGWQGQIARADIQSQRFSDWQLVAPGFLSVGADTLATDTLCWKNSQDAKLCTSLIKQDSSWQSELAIDRLPLSLFSRWFPADLKVEGKLNGSAKLNLQGQILLGQVTLQLPEGVVHYPILEGERDHWDYRGGQVTVLLSEKGLKSNAELAMSNGDRLQFEAELPGAQLLGLDYTHQPLRAHAQLSVHDLGLIEALIPEIQDLRGQVALDLKAIGTLAKPELKGSARLIDGSLRIPRLGLTIEQLSLLSQNNTPEKMNFQLNARSGEGNLVIDGKTTLDKNRGWPTEFSIKGDAFEVAQIPEAQIRVSPDLKVRVKKRNVNISGDVQIPYARLQPKDITTAAQVSSDAIILGNEPGPTEKWAITSDVRLTLGDQIYFYGYGFEGRFGGSLLLQDEPGQSTRATGEITIPEGRYRAYGQRLDVEQGRLVFSGGPPSNPGLDVRAVRHINDITAGLKLRGNLNKPQIELFSIPAMGQTDTLAYLLLGRPLDKTSSEDANMVAQGVLALGLTGGDHIVRALGNRFGMDEMRIESNDTGDQASLVMGRHLTPRLYVGYGVGLINAINTFNVHYQISKHWQLKGESGENSGMDILYTIDR
ncbi:MAG: translocation/assembly module TamB domain-containing protein [Pseudomonadales bacterium]|nr:translocation/assembly module TamB domain-containing protein [Pseudomonadales bacterium]